MPEDLLVTRLKSSICYAARVLAVLMVLMIWWGVADVVYLLYCRVSTHPYFLLEISDILATFGAFMAVLIATAVCPPRFFVKLLRLCTPRVFPAVHKGRGVSSFALKI